MINDNLANVGTGVLDGPPELEGRTVRRPVPTNNLTPQVSLRAPKGRGNLNVHRIAYPIPIGHDGTQYLEIATVASLPRNDTIVAGFYIAKR